MDIIKELASPRSGGGATMSEIEVPEIKEKLKVYGIPAVTADDSSDGLMSNKDKIKLDNIEEGANKTVVDSALIGTSTNPVQNKVVYTALQGKASTAVATTGANGLMPATDKKKIDCFNISENTVVMIQEEEPSPISGKTIIWIPSK